MPAGRRFAAPNFNSRPSARGDANGRRSRILRSDFNSRPSARGDEAAAQEIMKGKPISIHAPPRGATGNAASDAGSDQFQFTPLREGRRLTTLTLMTIAHFNSRPSARGDIIDPRRSKVRLAFQFTPLREGRPELGFRKECSDDFNSRPSARGDPGLARATTAAESFQFTPLREGRRAVRSLRATC